MSAERHWYTPSEAARLAGVDVQTLTEWANDGKITVKRTKGGHRRYPGDELQALSPSVHMSTETALDVFVQNHFGGDAVAALLAVARQFGIGVAYLDRRYFEHHLARRGHPLTDEEWKRIASELTDFCAFIDGIDQVQRYVTAVLRAAMVGPDQTSAHLRWSAADCPRECPDPRGAR
jgi:excisionase family DNA binding protein